MFIARFSNHINEDLQRNWSSYNSGLCGFEGTQEELVQRIEDAISDESSVMVSGDYIEPVSYRESRGEVLVNGELAIRELYENYWTLVDNSGMFGSHDSLCAVELSAETLEAATEEAKGYAGKWACTSDEIRFSSDEVVTVHSTGWLDGDYELHIIEI